MFSFASVILGLLATSLGVQAAGTTVVVKNLKSKDGTAVYAEARGTYNKPHVIFAHGLACTTVSWDALWEDSQMQNNLYMVRYDTRGHGRSGKPVDESFYSSDRYAQDLSAIISAFSLSKPFFAGWSLAGAIAADIAANFPHPLPFSGLIWVAPLPYFGDILTKVATPTVLGFLPGLENTDDAAVGIQTRIDFVETLSAQNDKVPFNVKAGWVGSANYLPPAIATRVLSRTQNETRLLQEAAAGWPLLIVHGALDKQINGTTVISNMAPKFKNVETHLIPGAGHMVFYDATSTVKSYILAFVDRAKKQYP